MKEDERFADFYAQGRNRDALEEELQKTFIENTQQHWLDLYVHRRNLPFVRIACDFWNCFDRMFLLWLQVQRGAGRLRPGAQLHGSN